MKTNELQLVSYKQAEKLEGLGFSWDTDENFYNFSGELLSKELYRAGVRSAGGYIPAPTVALTLKWFRDVKNLTCWIDRNATGYYFGISKADNGTTIYLSYEEKELEFETYEQAESILLDELLKLK